MLETSTEIDQSNNVIQFPVVGSSPKNIEEFKKLLIENKMEVIDAFTDEIMSEIIRICYSYGYHNLDHKDISYVLISIKSTIMRAEGIGHSFQERVDQFIEEKMEENIDTLE